MGIQLNCQCCATVRSVVNTMCIQAMWKSNPSFLMPGRQSISHSGLWRTLHIPAVFPRPACHSDFTDMSGAPGGVPSTTSTADLFDNGYGPGGPWPNQLYGLETVDLTLSNEVDLSGILSRIVTALEALNLDTEGIAWGTSAEYDFKDIPSWYQCFAGPGFSDLLSANDFTPYDGSLAFNSGVHPGVVSPASSAIWILDSTPVISLTRTQVKFTGATCAQVTWLIREACSGPPFIFSDPFNGLTVSPTGGIIDIAIPSLVTDFWSVAGPYVSNCTGSDCGPGSGIWDGCPVGVFCKLYPQYATYADWLAAGSPF